jgi:hypothetical protein
MLDAKEKKRTLDGLFQRKQNDPKKWFMTAWNLRTAADVLFQACEETREPGGEPIHPENEHLDSPATMLYGCAMENIIKGYLIKKHGGFEPARAVYKKAWGKHQISVLAVATGLPLTPEQRLLLCSLEAFIVWAGRYPISMNRDQFTIPRQLQAGDHITPIQIRHNGIELLQPFFKQLEDDIFPDLPKNLADLDLNALS